ncbi:hypothetical protein E2C01_053034 [Portunus trituberculatus]|uniref:Uncharacterized protein n=1 Tax=Portunus trituberculatus TaxID=210409 RepID=A0A5B7GN39_PORTR|nr:hypothetical protein [Portunus trituberculatus]
MVAKVIGLLVAAIPAVELGKLHYRRLERDGMRKDLRWWIIELGHQDRKIFRRAPDIEVFTDPLDLS